MKKSLAEKPNSTNKSFVSNWKCLNESVDVKPNLSRKFLLQNQTPPTKVLFRIQNVWMKVLIWNNRQKACCENKLFQQKLCFKFKIFELKSWCETKIFKKSLASKPNCAKKCLVSNSKCLNRSLELKINFQRKIVLWNQTVPTKVLFWIQNVFKKVETKLRKEKSWCCLVTSQFRVVRRYNIYSRTFVPSRNGGVHVCIEIKSTVDQLSTFDHLSIIPGIFPNSQLSQRKS